MGQITLICGSVRSERSATIDALWREHSGAAILLTPTARLARARQSAFVRSHRLPGLFGNWAWELNAFARAVVEASGRQVRMMSRLERKLMTRKALEDLPADIYCPEITPGLVAHLLQVITDLKQAAVEPQTFCAALEGNGGRGIFDRLVAVVYERYQTALVAEDRYDVPGLYWEAERCCREVAPMLPNNADTILLDGFDDFTLSQQRFLGALAERVSRLVIGLHFDPDPDRSDLFHLQQRWVEKFRALLPVEIVTFPTEPPQDYIRHIARHLFWRQPPPSPATLHGNARIVVCADAQHEMESIGRQVKQLITGQGVAPQRIAVCLADMEQMSHTLRDIFKGFGIPASMRFAPRLLTTATGAFLMRLLDALDTWDRHTVTTLLASDLIHTDPEEAPLVMAFPLLSRRAGIVMGREEWEHAFARLEKQVAGDSVPERDAMVIPQAVETLALFQTRLRQLVAMADELPETDTVHGYAEFLDRQIDAFGMEEAAAARLDPEVAQREAAAVRAARSLLEQLAVAPHADTPVSRAEFARFLGEALGDTPIAVRDASGGGVFCCGLDGLRHERFDYVFLGGLNEGVLPRAARINAVYSESDLARLRRMKIDLPGRYEHNHRERLLFCHAVNAAQQELTLSWRKQDTSGRDALPGPFVVDIADMFEAHQMSITRPEPGPDCFLPNPTEAASVCDLANVAYYRDYRQLQADHPALTAPIDRVVAIETRRNSAAPFDIYDGCLASPDLLEVMAARYGDTAQFSVNQIESYLQFPFRFFMERILNIRETNPPEAELDPRTRGSIAHDALYRFHKRYVGQSVACLLDKDEHGTHAAMQDCARAAFRSHERHLLSVPDVILRVEQRRLAVALDRYLDRAAADFGSEPAPVHFEATFGRAPRNAEEDLYVAAPFPLTIGDETFLLTGKIDRIDADQDTARIIDYKSSATPSVKNIKNGLDLQLTVYAWAVENHLLPGVACCDAYYYSVYKNDKRDALLKKKEEDYEQREANARVRIADAIRGIRSGQFPPLPDPSLNLDWSPIHTAARYEQWRIERKATSVQQ